MRARSTPVARCLPRRLTPVAWCLLRPLTPGNDRVARAAMRDRGRLHLRLPLRLRRRRRYRPPPRPRAPELAAEPMIRFHQTFGAHTGRSLTFEKDVIRFGRLPDCEMPFDPQADLDRRASRRRD